MVAFSESWTSCVFNETALDLASQLRSQDYPGLSIIRCLSIATFTHWVYLVLLGASSGCRLFELNALAVGNVKRNSTAGDSLCMVPDRFIGCKDGVEMVLEGNTFSVNISTSAGFNMTKILNCSEPYVETGVPQIVCEPPYKSVPGFGCIYRGKGIDKRNFTVVEEFCHEIGATVPSPKNNEEFKILSSYIEINLSQCQVFLGVMYDEDLGTYHWQSNGREVYSEEWTNDQPKFGNHCVFIASWTGYKLKTIPCSGTRDLFCVFDSN